MIRKVPLLRRELPEEQKNLLHNRSLSTIQWISPLLNEKVGQVEPTAGTPPSGDRVRGLLAYADGTNWNPNSQGEGFYYWNGTAWVRILCGAFGGALVKMTSQQSISNTTLTALLFTADEYDTHAIHDNATNTSRLTVPTGVTKVRLTGNVQWDNNSTGVRYHTILKNGANVIGGGTVRKSAAAESESNIVSAVVSVSAGDYFELIVYQDSGGSLNVKITKTFFAMEIVECFSDGGGGSGTPSDTVEAETSFGISSSAGTATAYSRGDHTHGSPTDPVPTHEAAADPHTGYQKESEKSAANGYASLGSNTKVPTAELGGAGADATKFLRGDQTWVVPSSGGLSNPDRAVFEYHDFFGGTANAMDIKPWYSTALAAGSLMGIDGVANHPGVQRVYVGTSANSGRSVLFVASGNIWTPIVITGSEETNLIFKSLITTNCVLNFGFIDKNTVTAFVNAIYLNLNGTTLQGTCTASSSSTNTSTTYTISADTWYRLKIVVNSDATRVDFYIYNEAGSQLWTDYVTTNIPTGSTGHGFHGYRAVTGTSTNIQHIDYMDLSMYPTR